LKFAQHLYLNRISNDHVGMHTYVNTRELGRMELRRRDKKNKNAQKNVHKVRPLKNVQFCSRLRKTKILTTPVRSAGPTGQAGIH
jgi:hypothetical protein